MTRGCGVSAAITFRTASGEVMAATTSAATTIAGAGPAGGVAGRTMTETLINGQPFVIQG